MLTRNVPPRALTSSPLVLGIIAIVLALTAAAAGQQLPPSVGNAGRSSEGHAKLSAKARKFAKYDISRIGEREVGTGVNFYSLERERALGRELAAEIETQSRLISDPVVTEYVNRLGQSIVRNSDARVPFTIKVIDDDEINAFALPGGYFYVDTGLIMAAENESELAGVMAHEVAHVAARHATKSATRAQLWNMASLPLIFLGGPAGYAVREVAGLAVPMSFLKFSRDAEREADLLGIEYEYTAGYDPQSFVQFFEKLEARERQKPNFLAKAFTTHPMNSDRIKRAQKAISTMLPARQTYIVDTSEFEEVKARLAQTLNAHHPNDRSGPVLKRRGPEGKEGGNGPVLRRSKVDPPPPAPN